MRGGTSSEGGASNRALLIVFAAEEDGGCLRPASPAPRTGRTTSKVREEQHGGRTQRLRTLAGLTSGARLLASRQVRRSVCRRAHWRESVRLAVALAWMRAQHWCDA